MFKYHYFYVFWGEDILDLCNSWFFFSENVNQSAIIEAIKVTIK